MASKPNGRAVPWLTERNEKRYAMATKITTWIVGLLLVWHNFAVLGANPIAILYAVLGSVLVALAMWMTWFAAAGIWAVYAKTASRYRTLRVLAALPLGLGTVVGLVFLLYIAYRISYR